MTLYVLRHAIARDRSEWNKKDSERPLTKEGVNKMRKAARGMKRLKLTFDAILTSPYRRAYDTAEIVTETFKAKKKLKIVNDLASDGDPKRLMQELSTHYVKAKSLLLVGHEPYLSRLVSVLIGADHPIALDFKKGGLCRLETAGLRYGKCASLEWVLPPKLLKRI